MCFMSRSESEQATNECGARWLESAEVFCTKEAGHAHEHEAKTEIQYANGTTGRVELSWKNYTASGEAQKCSG